MRAKRIVCAIICLLILMPLIPFAALANLLRLIADGIDWVFDQSWLAIKLVSASDHVAAWFGFNEDTIYEERRRRNVENSP